MGFFTNDAGGIEDDLMFANRGDDTVRGGQCSLQGGRYCADARGTRACDIG